MTELSATPPSVAQAPLSWLLRWLRPRWIEAISLLGVLVALLVDTQFDGLPLGLPQLFLWLGLGLVAVSVRHLPSTVGRLLRDGLPLGGLLVAYGIVADHADKFGSGVHFAEQIGFDRWLAGGQTATVWLQHHLWHAADPRWYDDAITMVYLSHFVLTFVVLAVLWKVRHRLFLGYAGLFLALTLAGIVTYALYPAAPPWMASQHGLIAPTTRVVGAAIASLGGHVAGGSAIGSLASTVGNPVAAVPSLHAAYPALILFFFWPRTRSRILRLLLVAYPLAMGFTLVYGGEHYVFDVLLGWLYAGAVVLIGNRLAAAVRRRRDRHRRTPRSIFDRSEPIAPTVAVPEARSPADRSDRPSGNRPNTEPPELAEVRSAD